MGVGAVDWDPRKEQKGVPVRKPLHEDTSKRDYNAFGECLSGCGSKITMPGGCAGGGNWVLASLQEAREVGKRQSPSAKTIPGTHPSWPSFPPAPTYFSVGRVPKGFESGPLPTSIINRRKQRK